MLPRVAVPVAPSTARVRQTRLIGASHVGNFEALHRGDTIEVQAQRGDDRPAAAQLRDGGRGKQSLTVPGAPPLPVNLTDSAVSMESVAVYGYGKADSRRGVSPGKNRSQSHRVCFDSRRARVAHSLRQHLCQKNVF